MPPDSIQAQPQMIPPAQGQAPVGLPAAVPAAGLPVQLGAAPLQAEPALPPLAPETAQLAAAEQVNQLIAQYGDDPYQLNEALSRLRSSYVAEQYHITPNEAEGR